MAKNPTRKQIAKTFDWTVRRVPLRLDDGTPVESHVANVRDIDGEPHVLGVVGKGYHIIQNNDLLDLAEDLRKRHKLRIRFAGIVGQGERVFMQCGGERFSIGSGDEVEPYMLLANGHDGCMSCRMTPMTERLVCTNQLTNIQRSERTWVTIRHSGDVKTRLAEAGRLAEHFLTASAANRQLLIKLRDRSITKKQLSRFFESLYSSHYGEVSSNPQDETEDRAKTRAERAFGQFMQRFENEIPVAGASAWNMANAYTGWLQHDHRVGRDPKRSAYRRLVSSLFGVLAERSVEAFQSALAI